MKKTLYLLILIMLVIAITACEEEEKEVRFEVTVINKVNHPVWVARDTNGGLYTYLHFNEAAEVGMYYALTPEKLYIYRTTSAHAAHGSGYYAKRSFNGPETWTVE